MSQPTKIPGNVANNKKALAFIQAAKQFEQSKIDSVHRNNKIAWCFPAWPSVPWPR